MDILEDWAAIRKVNLEVFLSEFFFFFGYESCIYFSVFIVLFSNYNYQSVSNKKNDVLYHIFFLRQKGHWQGEDKKVGHYLIYLHFQNNFAIVGLWYKQIDHLFGMANVPVDLTTLLCTWLWQIFVRTSANKIQFKRLVGHT